MIRPLELLAPAKDLAHGQAAILCGADAVYVGAPRFGARASAGVPVEQIRELCSFAHGFEARVYVAMNTLIFENELDEAERLAGLIYEAGADALIIQDMSFLRMKNMPPIELHASTQTFNMSAEKIKFLSEAGFTRVILERALSAEEIAQIHRQVPDIELEAFVHGAICVGYSGRCQMSRTISNRSGNRGVCMQPCRLPYNLLDEHMRPLIKDKYLLSVQDLNLSDSLGDMTDAGVSSFKIEGRLKDIGYVKNIVTHYRRELDKIISSRKGLARASKGISSVEFDPVPHKSFSRGATSYYFHSLKNKVSSFDTPKSSGEYAGTVIKTGRGFFELTDVPASVLLSNGDGICFIDGNGKPAGTNINRVENGKITPNSTEGLERGMKIFRNYDHGFVSRVENSRMKRSIDISVRISVSADRLALSLTEGGTTVYVVREGSFEPALNGEKAEETVRSQIAKTGDTIYRVGSVDLEWDSPRFVQSSIPGEMRREAVEKLTAERMKTFIRRTRRQENKSYPYPESTAGGDENVVNSLSEQFYRDHGVRNIENGHDLSEDLTGKTVMRMRYCLRRETGQCLKENPTLKGKLYLENGLNIYELVFDCAECSSSLVYKGKREKKQMR